ERHRTMHAICRDAMQACMAALQPGEPIGAVFDAYARLCDAAGMTAHRLNACGYSLGTTFAPNWMDWPMFYRGNPVVAQPGMVFFLHMILMDGDGGLALCRGGRVEVTADGPRALSQRPLDLVVGA